MDQRSLFPAPRHLVPAAPPPPKAEAEPYTPVGRWLTAKQVRAADTLLRMLLVEQPTLAAPINELLAVLTEGQ